MAAGTEASFSDLEELADLVQTEAEALGPLDELDALRRFVPVEPVTRRAALGFGQEPDALVVAQGVGGRACPFGELGHRQLAHGQLAHGRRINLGVDSKVKCGRREEARRCAGPLGTVGPVPEGDEITVEPMTTLVPALSRSRAWIIALMAVLVLYAVTLENGAVLADGARFLHEAFHDGRHFLGVPCH